MPSRLLVMFTDAAIDNVTQHGECGSMSFCGARDRYPDNALFHVYEGRNFARLNLWDEARRTLQEVAQRQAEGMSAKAAMGSRSSCRQSSGSSGNRTSPRYLSSG